jgi:nucleoside-diphosphate-sugar epimerase
MTGNPVLVTGAAGFVGSHVTRALAQAGRPVIATDMRPGLAAPALAGLDPGSVRYLHGDLRGADTLAAILAEAGGRVDVVHAGAVIQFSQLGRSLGEGSATLPAALAQLDINAAASWRLLGGLAGAGALGRFVHVSTRSVFGGRLAATEPVSEDSPPQPAGMYGWSKAAAEAGILALRGEFGIDAVIARITGVFGPWQGGASWIGQAVDAVVAGRPYQADAGSEDAYELTYVKDTVRGLVQLLQARDLRHAVYHVASGQRLIRLAEVADAIRAADPRADVDFGRGAHAAAAGRTPLAVSRVAQDAGFTAQWELRDAIADYLRIERGGSYAPEAMSGGPGC